MAPEATGNSRRPRCNPGAAPVRSAGSAGELWEGRRGLTNQRGPWSLLAGALPSPLRGLVLPYEPPFFPAFGPDAGESCCRPSPAERMKLRQARKRAAAPAPGRGILSCVASMHDKVRSAQIWGDKARDERAYANDSAAVVLTASATLREERCFLAPAATPATLGTETRDANIPAPAFSDVGRGWLVESARSAQTLNATRKPVRISHAFSRTN